MEEYIIRKEDGSIVKWNKTKNNGYFCLLHYDNKQKYSFSPVQNLKCQLFMIGGGGAGGYFFGGGGGAGAAYINNNYIFEKTKSYSFEIGTGGRCDIDNINNLFKSGLNLKVFNNTNPNLDSVSFTYDDYTSLGINSASIVQSFVVNNINIPPSIFNNNTTYIWDGYIKPNDTGFIKVNVNSKIKTIIWVDKYIFNNSSAIVDGININDVKIVQLDSNKFYNIKIIAYNFDTSNSNFNISFENCQLYNFDKTGEIYNYIPATDTNLTYRNNDDNIPNIIKCKAGGFGGCGLYNQNNNLDGGCGGGSGINKKNGKSLADPGFNGNDGAVGTYCGGGGGIISPGINDKGGEGKIIEWFSSDLLFGAGGNAATFRETRNLGYGCGGNGAECCYFSKLLVNNDGNNGCVLIYVNSGSDDVIEGFTNNLIGKSYVYLDEDSIVNTLIRESFNIILDTSIIGGATSTTLASRYDYYDKYGGKFANLCANEGPTSITSGVANTAGYISNNGGVQADNNNMMNYIYDMLVISKLYAVVYRLYYHHFTATLNNDINIFDDFLSNVTYTFTDTTGTTGKTQISNYNVNINGLFDLTNLKLGTSTLNTDYYSSIYGTTSGTQLSTDLNMSQAVYDKSKENIGLYPVPAYHLLDGAGTSLFNFTFTNINKINPTAEQVGNVSIATTPNNTSTTQNYLNIYNINATPEDKKTLNKNSLSAAHTANLANINTYKNNYIYQRIALYLEQFNIILNTNPNILLSTLKYKMFYYNAVIYNVSLQYNLFLLQKSRITGDFIGASTATAVGADQVNTDITTLATNMTSNLNYIIINNINTTTFYTDVVKKISDNSSRIKSSSDDLNASLENLNDAITKYNNDLEVYNTYLDYYKIIMGIAIAIIIIIVLIFTMKSIDNNTKIMIFAAIAIVIIVLFILYNNSLSITTETFDTCRRKYLTGGEGTLAQIDFSTYKTMLYKYMSYIMVLLSTQSITKNTLYNIDTHINNTINSRNKTIALNSNKIKNYQNASELLKKSANDYYYFIILIVFSVIILMFGISLYLLYPNMLLNIFVFAVIPFLILVFYVMYKINQSTRMVENKNYWSIYNPSEKTLATL
jgi:hypothetical protein